ncbi:MAG TPA: hypothetical protein ENH92_03215 [Ectothiorhodospiraceae bacterium]|nr:hypothetical protein [Ectothiorhodospiraceae bacterium]
MISRPTLMNNPMQTRRLLLPLLLSLLLLSPLSASAAIKDWLDWDRWELSGGTGTGFSKKTPLDIYHPNGDIHISDAKYDTKAWSTLAPYTDIRYTRWDDGGKTGWEAEILHHKLFLQNKPANVDAFAISHGYNMFTINRVWKKNDYILRAGGGFVLTHPETIIYGTKFDADGGGFFGFYLKGWTVQLAIEKRYPIQSGWFKGMSLFTEAKLTTSRTTIPISDGGTAVVPNTAVHGIVGLVIPLNLFIN